MQKIQGLNKLKGDWSNIKSIILYGAGLEAYRTTNRIINDFPVECFVDANEKKHGKTINGLEIRGLEELEKLSEGTKVIITIARRRYLEIKGVLEEYGLKENYDFCHISQFAMEWYYNHRGECCVFTMDMAITTMCNLKCKKCNMFIPYYDKPIVYTFEDLKNSLDLFFETVDYVFALGILGGEALLHPEFETIIDYIVSSYGERIGSILVTTNGLRVPERSKLECIAKNKVLVTISDYRYSIKDKSKLEELVEVLNGYGIVNTIRESLVWCDFGFPLEPERIELDMCRKHMLNCDPGWRGLNDGKFYFCNVAWSAQKANLFTLNSKDYIDLKELSNVNDRQTAKMRMMNYTIGNLENGYMSFCQVCGGCGEDNQKFVNAGEQSL